MEEDGSLQGWDLESLILFILLDSVIIKELRRMFMEEYYTSKEHSVYLKCSLLSKFEMI